MGNTTSCCVSSSPKLRRNAHSRLEPYRPEAELSREDTGCNLQHISDRENIDGKSTRSPTTSRSFPSGARALIGFLFASKLFAASQTCCCQNHRALQPPTSIHPSIHPPDPSHHPQKTEIMSNTFTRFLWSETFCVAFMFFPDYSPNLSFHPTRR